MCWGELEFCAVCGSGLLVRSMLGAGRWCVLKSMEGFGVVAWHGDVDVFGGVVPSNGEAAIEGARPVDSGGVRRAHSSDEVICVGEAQVLDAKVVGNEAEGDVVALVTPEAGGSRRGGVAVFGKVGGEANIGNEAGLFEAVHALADFNVDPSVRGSNVVQVVLLDDFSW